MGFTAKTEFLALAVFTGLVLLAAEEDAREFRISNRVSLLIALLAPVHMWTGGLEAALSALGFAVVVLVVGAALFARGWVGGGDVKFLAAIALWSGWEGAPLLIAVTTLSGAVLALGALLVRFRRAGLRGALRAKVPYGPAIAMGGLAALASSAGSAMSALAG